MHSTVGNVFHTYSEKLVGVRHQTWKFAVIGWLLIASITSAPAYIVICCRYIKYYKVFLINYRDVTPNEYDFIGL
jgi:hypothetical protein